MKYILSILALISIVSCNSVNYPKAEDSQKLIDQYTKNLESFDKNIQSKNINLKNGNDLSIKIPSSTFNKIFDRVSNSKNEDLTLDFWYSPNVVSKEVSVLGMKTVHNIDIESGKITLDLKNLKFENLNNNLVNGLIDLEGKGNVTVVGKSTGLSAKATPLLQLNLNEVISFDISNDKNSNLVLSVKPKQIKLKTRTSIQIFGLEIPWNQEIPLEINQLIQPITLPLALQTEIAFPLPAQKFGTDKIQYSNYLMKLSQTKVNTQNNKLEYKTNIDFIKK